MNEEHKQKLLELCAKHLLDAVSIMNDGPDDSDKALANSILEEAIEAARQWRRLNATI